MGYDVLVAVTVVDEEGSEVDASMSGFADDLEGVGATVMQLAADVAADAQEQTRGLTQDGGTDG